MLPVSGLPGQVPSTQPARETSQEHPQEAVANEPEDSYLPSEGLDKSQDDGTIGDRGALVRRDLKDRNFLRRETEHFILYYLPDTDGEREIDDIAEKREEAYGIISQFLNVTPQGKISIYIFPSDRESFCPTWNKTFAGRTIPEAGMVGLAYISDNESYEKINFGHELTHALEFGFLRPQRRVPPFLREGMADYLCMSGEDMHLRLSRFTHMSMVEEPFSLTEDKLNRPEYMESASFVQCVTGAFGAEACLRMYDNAAILSKGERISRELFSDIVKASLGCPLETLTDMWKEQLIPYLGRRPEPMAHGEEIVRLMELMEAATRSGQEHAILKIYSNDFYYRSPRQEKELITTHLDSCLNDEVDEVELFDMGTWGYGKTVAVTLKDPLSSAKAPKCFLCEKIWGTWRLNPKFVGGWYLPQGQYINNTG